jgi:hypothetical protein
LKLSKLLKKEKKKTQMEEIISDKRISLNLSLFEEISAQEIAEQLTIMTFEQFQMLNSFEFLSQNRNNAKEKAKNLDSFIQFSNTISFWVTTMILSERNLDDRVEVISKFIHVANEAFKLQNFTLMMGILPGLNSNSIFRLKKTFSSVPKEDMEIYNNLKIICSSENGFKNLRTAISKCVPPCVPFIGIYLTDLTFIEDGNPNFIDSLVNWSKRDLFTKIIRDIQLFQQEKYNITGNPKVLKYLSQIHQIAKDPEDLYEESLLIEPRNKEEDEEESTFNLQGKRSMTSVMSFSKSIKSFGLKKKNQKRKSDQFIPGLKKFTNHSLTPSHSPSPNLTPTITPTSQSMSPKLNSPLSILNYESMSVTPSPPSHQTPLNTSPRSNEDDQSDTDSSSMLSTELMLDVLQVSVEEHQDIDLKDVLSTEIGKFHFVDYMKKNKYITVFLDFMVEYLFMQQLPQDSPEIKSCALIISQKYLKDSSFVRLLIKNQKNSNNVNILEFIEKYASKLEKQDPNSILKIYEPIYEIIEIYMNKIYDEFVKLDDYHVMIEKIQESEHLKNTISIPIEGAMKQYMEITDENQILSLIKKMRSKKNGISGYGTKFLYQLKYYDNCFKGSHLVAWLKSKYSLKTAQAIAVGEQLFNECYLHHIGDTQPFLNNETLYRFNIDDNSKVLNTHRKFNGIPFSAIIVSQKIQKSQLEIQEKFESKSGIDYEGLKKSDFFKEFVNLTVELQSLSIDELSEKEKKCFFINIYNSLLIHVFLIHGSFKNQLERSKFFSLYKYDIGGFYYSLNDIKDGILRSNSPGPTSPKSFYFPKNDQRLKYILKEKDPRILFALVNGPKSVPKIRCFDTTNLEIGLNLACSNYLDQDVSIVNKNTIKVGVLFKWYAGDFGKTNEDVCRFIFLHLTEGQLQNSMNEFFQNPTGIKIKYKSYNWSINNSSQIF